MGKYLIASTSNYDFDTIDKERQMIVTNVDQHYHLLPSHLPAIIIALIKIKYIPQKHENLKCRRQIGKQMKVDCES